MSGRLTQTDLENLSACLMDHVGLHFPRERWRDIEHGIRSAAADFGFASERECADWLLASPLSRRQIEVLAAHLTVGETYFFRDRAAFEALKRRILPELIQRRCGNGERIRIWSAGCASGEEAYSIAIALDEVAGGNPDRRATILATDINPRSLDKAAGGAFGEWSFREVHPAFKQTYFERQGRSFMILPKVRQLILFSFLNLAEDTYPSLNTGTNAMDIIFCRNVLMYFSPRQAQKVVAKFHQCLADGGWLIVSPCEASRELFSRFDLENHSGAILFRKRQGESQPGACFPQVASPPVEHFPKIESGTFPRAVSGSDLPAFEPATLPEEPLTFPSTMPIEGPTAEDSEEVRTLQAAKSMARKARVLANQGKLAEALLECDGAIENDKAHAGYHFLRASILLERGELIEARLSLKRTLYLDGDSVLAHMALANLARQRNDRKGLARHLQIAKSILAKLGRDEVLPESEAMTAGRLLEIVEAELGVLPLERRSFRASPKVNASRSARTRKWSGGLR